MKKKRTAAIVLIFFILSAFILSSFNTQPALAEKRPTLGDEISYWSPQWLSNERIIYIKWIEHRRYWYGFFADLSDGGTIRLGEDYQICTANLEGKDEKVIRTFSVHRSLRDITQMDKFLEEKSEESAEGVLVPRYLSYNAKENIIAFSGPGNSPIIVMSADGKKVWKLDVGGYIPKFSPDGKRILYHKEITNIVRNAQGVAQSAHTESSDWIINISGTENKKVIEGSSSTIWHPDGKRIIFCRSSSLYALNLDTGSEGFLSKTYKNPEDISADGSKIILGGVLYEFETLKYLKTEKQFPNEAHISPDGNIILGASVDIDACIGIVNLDGTGFRKILENHFVTLK